MTWAWMEAHRRTLRWALVVVFALALPHAVVVFQMLNRHWPSAAVQQIPWMLVTMLGVGYFVTASRAGYSKRFLGTLLASLLITVVLLRTQRNPNKAIHIPEYIVLTWLLFRALSIDYRGKGIYALTFTCAGMLGVLDELMQGAHPYRFYGLADMGLNAAGGMIGIISLLGLGRFDTEGAAWPGPLRPDRNALILLAVAMLTAGYMCWRVHGVPRGPLRDTYPTWLLVGNALLAAAGAMLAVRHRSRLKTCLNAATADVGSSMATVHLWIVCLSVILAAMHALVFAIALLGLEFR
jgi:hypothetical protein